MANVKNGNTIYVDATGDVVNIPTKVYGVLLTATSANAHLKLSDTAASVAKLDVRVSGSHDSHYIDFSDNPLFFPNGVEVTTITNGVATLVL